VQSSYENERLLMEKIKALLHVHHHELLGTK